MPGPTNGEKTWVQCQQLGRTPLKTFCHKPHIMSIKNPLEWGMIITRKLHTYLETESNLQTEPWLKNKFSTITNAQKAATNLTIVNLKTMANYNVLPTHTATLKKCSHNAQRIWNRFRSAKSCWSRAHGFLMKHSMSADSSSKCSSHETVAS